MKFSLLETEADLLAELYHRGRLAGLMLKMEVIVPSVIHRSKRMRVDAALIHDGCIVALIEGKTPGAKIGGNTRQKHAYNALLTYHGIPTFWINSFAQIDPLLEKLQALTQAVAA